MCRVSANHIALSALDGFEFSRSKAARPAVVHFPPSESESRDSELACMW